MSVTCVSLSLPKYLLREVRATLKALRTSSNSNHDLRSDQVKSDWGQIR